MLCFVSSICDNIGYQDQVYFFFPAAYICSVELQHLYLPILEGIP